MGEITSIEGTKTNKKDTCQTRSGISAWILNRVDPNRIKRMQK